MKRGKPHGMAALKTASRCHLRASPKPGESGYLDLFVLDNSRKRIEQEIEHLHERLKRRRRDLKEVEEQMVTIANSGDVRKVADKDSEEPPGAIKWSQQPR